MLLRTSIAFAAFVLVLRPGTVSECAPQACNHIPHGGPESLEGFTQRLGGGCQASHLGYVKQWTKYIVHTHATAIGSCEHRSFQCATCPCETIGWNERNVQSIGVAYFDPMWPTWPNSLGPIYPVAAEAHDVDSRLPGTTTPPPDGRQFTPYYVGRYAVFQQSQIDPTACNMTPTQVEWSMALKSVACLPTFMIKEPNILRLPNDGTRVKIAAPETSGPVRTAIEAAAKAWNATLVSWGENPIFDETAQTVLCMPSQGAHCVQVRVIEPPGAACSAARADATEGGADGIFDSTTFIDIKPGYSTNASWLSYLLSHELGHLLGLMNADNCPTNTSVMAPSAGGCNNLGDSPTTPRPSDGLPVADTVYGPGSRNSCEGAPQ
jgi:hypothetical protein